MAMAQCLTAVPPLFRTAPSRAAACFLYKDVPALPAGELAAVLATA
jgi:hypothetical protein